MTKKIFAGIFVSALLFSAFTQEFTEPQPADKEDSIEELEKVPVQGKFNPELQRPFIIVGTNAHLNLNPHTSSFTNEAQIINGLQEGLFSYDSNTLDPVPALAESFKISRDKKRWTFTIRKNAAFSNGEPVTPQSIIDSWLKLQKTPGAQYASLLDCITGMKEYRENNIPAENVGLKASGQKLVVTLNTPTAHLSRLLCHHAFAAFNGDESIFSGAFTISSRDETTLVLSKNQYYWDKENVALPEIRIIFSDNEKENSWLFNTGRADWLSTDFDTQSLINKNALRISALFGTSYYFFTTKNQVWNNADFRNALLAAVPWDQLRQEHMIKASTLVYPLSGYPKVEGLTETNEDEALILMEEARKKAGIPIDKKLELTFGIARNDYMRKQAEILKTAWEPLGVILYPMQIDENQYLNSIPYLNYDMFSYSWIGDFADPMAFLELFREGSTLNQTVWKNQKFTNLMNRADECTDSLERYKLLAQAEQVLLDDGVILPVSHSITLQAVNLNHVGGWYTNALDIHPYKTLYFKEYKQADAPNIVMK